MTPLKVQRLRALDMPLPEYQTPGAAGLDLRAAEGGFLRAGEVRPWATGIAVEIPPGHEGQIRGRSGLAATRAIFAHVGTIDADFRGEVKVILVNLGVDPFEIKPGDRIGQLVVAPVSRVTVMSASVLGDTARGAGGFGSTGSS
jgi:dUTP pyrophosphatase